jgi:hypothetical protein
MKAASIKEATGGATGAEVVAIGAGASPAARDEVSLLGYLFWFSVSEAEVRREDLIRASRPGRSPPATPSAGPRAPFSAPASP